MVPGTPTLGEGTPTGQAQVPVMIQDSQAHDVIARMTLEVFVLAILGRPCDPVALTMATGRRDAQGFLFWRLVFPGLDFYQSSRSPRFELSRECRTPFWRRVEPTLIGVDAICAAIPHHATVEGGTIGGRPIRPGNRAITSLAVFHGTRRTRMFHTGTGYCGNTLTQ